MADDPTLADEHVNQLSARLKKAGNEKRLGHKEAANKILKGVRDELDGILKGWEKAKP